MSPPSVQTFLASLQAEADERRRRREKRQQTAAAADKADNAAVTALTGRVDALEAAAPSNIGFGTVGPSAFAVSGTPKTFDFVLPPQFCGWVRLSFTKDTESTKGLLYAVSEGAAVLMQTDNPTGVTVTFAPGASPAPDSFGVSVGTPGNWTCKAAILAAPMVPWDPADLTATEAS